MAFPVDLSEQESQLVQAAAKRVGLRHRKRQYGGERRDKFGCHFRKQLLNMIGNLV
jgi:hypothetical protein